MTQEETAVSMTLNTYLEHKGDIYYDGQIEKCDAVPACMVPDA